MMRLTQSKRNGFSLIEVLIAIAITMVVGVIAATYLSSAVDISESSEALFEDVNQLETVFQVMATDVHHIIDRRVKPPSAGVGFTEEGLPAFLGVDPSQSTSNGNDGNYFLRFVREGWANPLRQTRSDMQRVAYRLEEETLWRDYWPELNQPIDVEPLGHRFLAKNIEAVRIRFLPAGAKGVTTGPWVEQWPPRSGTQGVDMGESALPAAFEITVLVKDLGEIQRVFAMPGV